MQYKGKELIEMLPENWDGKSRNMLVWCDDTKPIHRIVCGYDPIHCVWLVAETQAVWKHCAEIPAEEQVLKKKFRRMTNRELSDLMGTGKVEKCYPYNVNGRDVSKVYRTHSYYRNKENSPCAKSMLIRYEGTDEWVKPLIEE